MKTAEELLELYAQSRSEEAFEQLVGRYIDLVYSAALRRVNGVAQVAEDVTQEVFAALARKAATLPRDVQLGGWLHRHTGFVASTLMRSETRRKHREMEAAAMHLTTANSDPEWNELVPVLDSTMDELSDSEREALVLRFFERRDFRAIGAALGVSDDTAQKRVSRALEKLRTLLLERKSSVAPLAALAAILETRSVHSAPVHLAARVSRKVLEANVATETAGAAAGVAGLAIATWVKLLLGIAAAVVITSLVVLPRLEHRAPRATIQNQSSRSAEATDAGPQPAGALSVSPAGESGVGIAAAQVTDTNALRLAIVAADSGKPVPNVQIAYRGWLGEKFQGKSFQANRAGICLVAIPRDKITELELTSRSDGFADTRLKWTPANGEKIPADYTLRLARAEAIGGLVLDENEQPLSGAAVGFNHEDDPVMVKGVETHEFGWIQVNTDADGHWSINRIAPEVLRRIYGSAHHPEHIQSPMVSVSRDEAALKQMLAGKHVFHVGKAIAVHGVVMNSDGEPIAGAKVLAGKRSMSGSRTGKTGPDGSFEIKGCAAGTNVLTAEATNYSATTINVEFKEDSEPFRLVLQRGSDLLVRVLGKEGKPVPNATFYLDTLSQRPINSPDYNKTAVQADFQGKSDAHGLLAWSNAPDADLDFDISASGYMRMNQVKLRPDGTEHTVTLTSALVVSGTVRDADSGESIPTFRLVTGFPQTSFQADDSESNGMRTVVTPNFPTIDRYWTSYADGKFKKTLEEPALYDKTNPGYVFKVAAEGYAPFVSRVIAADEGEVQLEIALKKVQTGQITVLLPDGKPAALAEVAFVVPDANPQLTPSGFSRMNQGDPSAVIRADDQGHCQFTADPAIQKVIAAHPNGYVEVAPSVLLENPVLRLEPWGRLEGTWTVGGKPASNRKLIPRFAQQQPGGVVFDFLTFQTHTDADGHYVFAHVPAGKLKLIYLSFSPPNSFAHVPLNNSEVEIRAGETSTKDLGGEGYVVTVHLKWPADIKPDKDWQCFGSIQTVPPSGIREAIGDPQKLSALQGTPEVVEYARTAKHYQMQNQSLDTLAAEEVPPGDYMIMVNAFQHTGSDGPTMNLMGTSESIMVPATPANGNLDAGTIQLQAFEAAQKQK